MCEDGRGKIYKERHLKLKPDVCVSASVCACAKAVLVSRLPAMPFSWPVKFFFKEFVVLKKYVWYN